MTNKTHETMINPFTSEVDHQTFYLYPSLNQRLHMTLRLFNGISRLILILGEEGSGKTLLMAQIMADDEVSWKGCMINTDSPTGETGHEETGYRGYMYGRNERPIVMLDDAHGLDNSELLYLIGLTGVTGSDRQIDKLILLGEPTLLNRFSEFADMIPATGAIEKVFMPRMTLAEANLYLDKHLKVVGFNSESFFSPSERNQIHKESGGYPGEINRVAARLFEKKNRPGKGLGSIFKQFFSG